MNRRADSPVSPDKSLLWLDIIQEQVSSGRSIVGNSPANHKVHEYGRILICSQVYDFFCRAWLICQTCCGFAFSQRSGSNSFNASGVGFWPSFGSFSNKSRKYAHGSTSFRLHVWITPISTAARSPPVLLATNSQFLRPIAHGFIARSATLLSIDKIPESQYRFNASNWFAIYVAACGAY